MKVKSESEVAQSCSTLSDPMDCSLPGSSIHGIFQAKVLEWGAIAFSNDYSGFISFRIDWFDIFAIQRTLESSPTPESLKASILQLSTFFMVQLSHLYVTTGKTIALTIQTFVGKVMSPPRWKMVTSVWAQAYGARLVGTRWLMIVIPATPAWYLTTNQIRGSLYTLPPFSQIFPIKTLPWQVLGNLGFLNTSHSFSLLGPYNKPFSAHQPLMFWFVWPHCILSTQTRVWQH